MQQLTVDRIIHLLEIPTDNRIPVYRDIRRTAHVRDLIAALEKAEVPLTRQLLCDMLGQRHARSAVPALLAVLSDSSPAVRSAAADALAKIGKASAGPTLLDALRAEQDDGARQMLTLALGAVGYAAANSFLIGLLHDPSGMVRGCAAWSLGALRAAQAQQPLRQALAKEPHPYAQERMRVALEAIAVE